MRPSAQGAASLFFFARLIICSTCPCREETGIVEKAMAVLKVIAQLSRVLVSGDYSFQRLISHSESCATDCY